MGKCGRVRSCRVVVRARCRFREAAESLHEVSSEAERAAAACPAAKTTPGYANPKKASLLALYAITRNEKRARLANVVAAHRRLPKISPLPHFRPAAGLPRSRTLAPHCRFHRRRIPQLYFPFPPPIVREREQLPFGAPQSWFDPAIYFLRFPPFRQQQACLLHCQLLHLSSAAINNNHSTDNPSRWLPLRWTTRLPESAMKVSALSVSSLRSAAHSLRAPAAGIHPQSC